jgi:hypothetical protein
MAIRIDASNSTPASMDHCSAEFKSLAQNSLVPHSV